MSLLRIIERHRLLDDETLARVHWLQANKGYQFEEALGPAHARVMADATAHLERERRGLHLAGLLRVFTELRQHPGALGRLLLLSAASAVFSFPFVFSWYLGSVLNHVRYTRDVLGLGTLTAVAATVLLTSTLMDFLLNTWAARCNFHINQSLTMRAWHRLLYLPFPRYQRQEQGVLLNKLTHVLEVLQKHQLHALRSLLYTLCMVVMTLGVLVFFHFAFVLLLLPVVLTTYVVPIVVSHWAAPSLREEPSRLGRVGNFLQVAFAAHPVLRLKGLEAVRRRLEALSEAHFLNQSRKWLAWNLGYNSKVAFNLLSFITLLWGGGALYFAGSIQLGELITVYLLVTMVSPKLDELYRIYVGGQSLHTHYEALDELLEMRVPTTGEAVSEPVHGAVHSLRLEGVGFRYRPGGAEVLREVDLELRRGQAYLVMGASGAGKSTLVDLLLGLLNPDAGRLLVNQEPLTEQARPGFWRRISLHEQSHFVFLDRTAEANITPPKRGSARGEAWWHLAQRLEFPRWGGKRPTELSGGERQRLCLLRTLARPADIYVFDEPTSALDRANAAIVMESILGLRDAIVLVISHDPEVRQQFAHVLQVDAGRVLVDAREAPRERLA